LKVLQVCTGYPPDRQGGVENMVRGLTEGLRRTGTDVNVLTRRWKTEVNLPHVTQIMTSKEEASGYALWALRSIREVQRARPDIVHCHGLEGAVVCSMLRFTPTRTVFHLHNSLTREGGFYSAIAHKVGSRILREGCISASAVVCPTQAVKSDLLRNIPSLHAEVFVIPNMVGRFHPWPEERVEALRSGLGLSGKKVILYFGKVKRSKGIEDLCRAYRMIDDKDRTALIVGGAPTWTENFLNELKREFPEAIFTGFVDDPTPYYQMADLFCIYTDAFEGGETFAISLAEAMSMGVPVVCSDNPIYREVTQNDAFFAEPKNPHKLAEVIQAALKDPDTASKHASRAKVTAVERYSSDAVISKIRQLYLRVQGDHEAKVEQVAPST
jgi:glycosyltransferase involved in cell wall biosynthesis